MGVDENKYPGLLEHFGMTTAEAMSYGCVPIVLNKAGYKETVEGNSGIRFNDKAEAIDSLIKLVNDKKSLSLMSRNSVKRAKRFSLQRMQKQIDEIIEGL